MADIHETYDALVKLTNVQLTEVILFAEVPSQYIPPASEPLARRAQDLIGWAKSAAKNHEAVRKALDRVLDKRTLHGGGPVDLKSLPLDPNLSDLTLVFDRDEQDSIDIGDEDRLIDEHVKDCFRAGQRVVVILLPGPPKEAHHDFVARFEKFTLKRICGDLNSPDVIAHKKGVWPKPRGTPEKRLRRLFDGLSEWVGQGQLESPTDPKAMSEKMQAALSAWMGQEKTHQVITYPLFLKDRRYSDAELIKRWVDFWSMLDLGRQPYTITLFLCIQSSPVWLSRWVGRSASSIRLARKTFKARSNVLILNRLTSPTKGDIDPWVDQKCDAAWEISHRPVAGQKKPQELPLNYDELKREARKAFGWWRKSRSFEKLKEKLETAIAAAHVQYKIRGSGR